MDNFGFPSNIKQIGNVDENMRIYIEDNVYSYLLKYAECNKNRESLAMLIGRCMIIDDEQVLFINGAIEGKYTYVKKGLMAFSEQSMQYIEEQKNTYFRGLEIVGWVISQPCFGNFLSGGYAKYHLDNFKKAYQVLFVTDPVEKIHSFFTYNEKNSDIEESKGFFIYYDKNKDMENYVAENEIQVFNIQEEITEEKSGIDLPLEEIEEIEEAKVRVIQINTSKPENENAIKYDTTTHNKVAPKVAIENKPLKDTAPLSRKKLQEKVSLKEKRKNNNIFVTISFLLFVSAFALGSNLLENSRKIETLTNDLNNVKSSYNNLVTYINENGFTSPEEETVQASGTTMIVKDFEQKDDSATADTETTDIAEAVDTSSAQATTSTPISNAPISNTTVPDTYVVESGDSLLNIAHTFYGTDAKVADIMTLNNIDNPDKIYIGMVLRLP